MSYSISISNFLFAPPDEVMELISNPEFITEWSNGKAEVGNKPGDKFEMFDGWTKGEIIRKTATELAYTWKPSDWAASVPASVVEIRLEAVEQGTEVHILHSDLPSEDEAESHKNGWKQYFFDPIGEYLSNRKF